MTRRALLRGAACAILLVAAFNAHAQMTALEVFPGGALLASDRQLSIPNKSTCLTTYTQGGAVINLPTTSCTASYTSGTVNSISVQVTVGGGISGVTGAAQGGGALSVVEITATGGFTKAYTISGLTPGDSTITFALAVTFFTPTVKNHTLVVTRTVPELTSLALSAGTLKPEFSSDIRSYTAAVARAAENITVRAGFTGAGFTATAGIAGGTASAITSGVSSGEIALAEIENIIEVTVGPTGNHATYRIVVTRADLPFVSDQADVQLHSGVDAALVLSAADGVPAYAYLLTQPPAGLTFDASTRTISGRPTATQATTTPVIYSASDSQGREGQQQFNISVAPPPALTSQPPATLILPLNAVARATLPAASGGFEPLVYELAGALPTGLEFDTNTLLLSGTPSEIADATLTYTAKDAAGAAGTASGIITANIRIRVLAFDLDVDLSGGISVQDGIMVARYLLGVRGASLIAGQSSGDAAMIGRNIQDGIDLGSLDVDTDGGVTGNDGILIARYLLGLRGDVLIAGMQGAVAATVAENVRALMP